MANTNVLRNPSSAGNSEVGTLSVWTKRANITNGNQNIITLDQSGTYFELYYKSTDEIQVYATSHTNADLTTKRKFRDTNAWYHVVLAIDSTQSTASNRLKLYINGEQITDFFTATYPGQGNNMYINQGSGTINVGSLGSSNYYTGSMSHFHWIDGTAYDASAFGETDATTGEWKIKTNVSVTYGTNGFFILKDGNSVTDQSGQGNNFTVSNGTLTKTEDNPSNVFCTNNYSWKQESSRYLTHTRGNTMISGGGSATWYQTPGTLAFNSGKFYWECKYNAATNLTQNHAGVIVYEKTQESGKFRDKVGSVFFTNEDGGEMHIDGPATTADYGTIGQNDILGVAVDMDATTPTVKFYKNGSLHASTNAASLAGKFVTPAQMIYQSGEFQLNFGNGYFSTTAVSSAGTNASGIGIFEYDVPTGFTALTTKGLNL